MDEIELEQKHKELLDSITSLRLLRNQTTRSSERAHLNEAIIELEAVCGHTVAQMRSNLGNDEETQKSLETIKEANARLEKAAIKIKDKKDELERLAKTIKIIAEAVSVITKILSGGILSIA